MLSEGFIEVHTPKLLGGASEGGAAVFRFDYMGLPGCLAQVPCPPRAPGPRMWERACAGRGWGQEDGM
jgi:hypothetical protein